MIQNVKLWIDGHAVDADSGQTFDCLNPATGDLIARVANGEARDVDCAVRAARRAFEGPWSRIGPTDRGRLLRRLADRIGERLDELAKLDTLDSGKPIYDTRYGDIPDSIGILEWFGGLPDRIRGATTATVPEVLAYMRREPFGVVGAIIPWNFPFDNAVIKLAPALACGNCLVLKPAEQTPLSAVELGRLCQEVGIPDGVVNIVTGFGPTAGAALVRHPGIDKIAFTGSVEVGKKVMAMAAEGLKPVTLELGGKSANIIFDDADLGLALPGSVYGMFLNQGQVCSAGTRLLVQRRILDRVLTEVVERAQNLRIGDPLDENTRLGALVSAEQRQRVERYVALGLDEGARLATGGQAPADAALAHGCYYAPTVLTEVDPASRVAQEEIFGPVLVVIPFDDEAEAIRIANGTVYGLTAGLWTRDIRRAHRVAHSLQAGMVWVNAYHGGSPGLGLTPYKQSGMGHESGQEVIQDYMRLKSIWVDLSLTPIAWPD
jgi:acyl-CoA reductase-like NAD-dependent aldehyde dehydrogenase